MLCGSNIKQEWAENGLAKIEKGYEALVAKNKIHTPGKADAIVAAITQRRELKEDACADCDLMRSGCFWRGYEGQADHFRRAG